MGMALRVQTNMSTVATKNAMLKLLNEEHRAPVVIGATRKS